MKKVFRVPIYGGRLFVRIANDLQEEVNKMGIEWDASPFYALSHQRIREGGKREYSVLLTPNVKNEHIAHESKHIVNMIFHHVDVRLDTQNDEAECYLLQWVFASIEAALIEYKKQNA